MADSNAERKRRSRRHQAGDHSTCHPDRCEHARPTRGQQLWEQLHGGLDPMQLVLLQEACRITDRLDRLHEHLGGGEWFDQSADGDGGADVTVVTAGPRALAEARQQAITLRGLAAELRCSIRRPPATAPVTAPQGAPGRKAGTLGDLTARIAAARRDAATG